MKTKFNFKNNFFKLTPAKTILLGFLLFILIGTFLLCLPISHTNNEWFSFVDSLFTSTSAVCVTGLAVIDIAKQFTLFGQFVVLFLIQIGGLGFVTITSLIFMILRKKINYATRLTIQESFNKENTQGVVKMVKCIVLITFGVEFVGFLFLLPSLVEFSGSFWGGAFKALFLSVSAFCNAGFDPLGNATPEFSSIAHFASNPFVLIPIMILIVIGGIGFIVLFDIFGKHKDNKRISFHAKVVLIVTAVLILGGALLFGVFEWNNPNTIGNMNVGSKILNCFFQSITPRTAGFATFDQGQLTNASVVLSDFLMIVGGSPTSVAGGLKTTTLFILILILIKPFTKNGHIVFKNKTIYNKVIIKSIKLLLTFICLIVTSTFLIYFTNGMSKGFEISDIVFECISALSTVGISRGLTPNLNIFAKLVVTTLMFVGRIGLLSVPLAFKSKNNFEDEIEYPDSKIAVG